MSAGERSTTESAPTAPLGFSEARKLPREQQEAWITQMAATVVFGSNEVRDREFEEFFSSGLKKATDAGDHNAAVTLKAAKGLLHKTWDAAFDKGATSMVTTVYSMLKEAFGD